MRITATDSDGKSVNQFLSIATTPIGGRRSVTDDEGQTLFKECMAPLKKRDVAPQLSAMLVSDAESLKSELRDAADYCLGVFREGLILGLAQLQ